MARCGWNSARDALLTPSLSYDGRKGLRKWSPDERRGLEAVGDVIRRGFRIFRRQDRRGLVCAEPTADRNQFDDVLAEPYFLMNAFAISTAFTEFGANGCSLTKVWCSP